MEELTSFEIKFFNWLDTYEEISDNDERKIYDDFYMKSKKDWINQYRELLYNFFDNEFLFSVSINGDLISYYYTYSYVYKNVFIMSKKTYKTRKEAEIDMFLELLKL